MLHSVTESVTSERVNSQALRADLDENFDNVPPMRVHPSTTSIQLNQNFDMKKEYEKKKKPKIMIASSSKNSMELISKQLRYTKKETVNYDTPESRAKETEPETTK